MVTSIFAQNAGVNRYTVMTKLLACREHPLYGLLHTWGRPSVTNRSFCDTPLRRILRATYLENGADECVLRLSLNTQCMSVSV